LFIPSRLSGLAGNIGSMFRREGSRSRFFQFINRFAYFRLIGKMNKTADSGKWSVHAPAAVAAAWPTVALATVGATPRLELHANAQAARRPEHRRPR